MTLIDSMRQTGETQLSGFHSSVFSVCWIYDKSRTYYEKFGMIGFTNVGVVSNWEIYRSVNDLDINNA